MISFELLGFSLRFSFFARFCFMLNTLEGQIAGFPREKFYRHALEYLQPVRADAAQFLFSPLLGKRLNVIEECEGLSSVDVSFAPINRDNSRPLKKLSM